MTLDPKELRGAFGTFMTGVTVVTTVDGDGNPRGFTANSFTSVSLDPPLLAICIAATAHSAEVFRNADGFAINVLSDRQIETSNLFASKRADKFEVVDWQSGPAGHPVLDNVVTWFDCTTSKTVEAGDHFILIGEVVAFASSDSNPLGFARGGYVSLGQERSIATAPATSVLAVSAIVEKDEMIWLVDNGQGQSVLPRQQLRRGDSVLGAAREMLRIKGCDAELGFLFAVYDNDDGAGQEIVYRAQASNRPISSGQFMPIMQAVEAVSHDTTLHRMLMRYSQEHAVQGFGIYLGPAKGGTVELLA